MYLFTLQSPADINQPCDQAFSDLRQSQRCSFILSDDIDPSEITSLDCAACRGLAEAIVTACGNRVCNIYLCTIDTCMHTN